jgi:hypothetical protein
MRSNSHYPHHRDSESRDQNAMPLSVRRKRFWPYAQYFRDPAARECPTIGSSVDPAGETRQRVASSAGLGKGSDTSRTAERYIEYDCPSQLLELQLTDTDTRNYSSRFATIIKRNYTRLCARCLLRSARIYRNQTSQRVQLNPQMPKMRADPLPISPVRFSTVFLAICTLSIKCSVSAVRSPRIEGVTRLKTNLRK